MLRSKQIISFYRGVRHLLIATSQSKSVNGALSSCSEDESSNPGPYFNISKVDSRQGHSISSSNIPDKGFFRKDLEESTGSIISPVTIPVGSPPTKSSTVSSDRLEATTQRQETAKIAQIHSAGAIGLSQPLSYIDNFVWAGLATLEFLSGLANLKKNNVLYMVNPDKLNSGIETRQEKPKSTHSLKSYTACSSETIDTRKQNILDRTSGSISNGRPASERYSSHSFFSKSTKFRESTKYVACSTQDVSTYVETCKQESIGSKPAKYTNSRGHISRTHIEAKLHGTSSKSETPFACFREKNGQHFGNLTSRVSSQVPSTSLLYHHQAGSKSGSRKFRSSTLDDSNSVRSISRDQAGYKQLNVDATSHLPLHGSIVDQVAKMLKQMNWVPATEMALANLNVKLGAYQVNQILKQLGDPSLALNFFYWAKRQTGFKHDGHSYTTMIGIFGRARQFDAVNKLLAEMKRDRCEPNVVTYNRLIHCYGRANYVKEAVKFFSEMQKAGCKPDRVTYCTLIDIHAKAGSLDVAMDFYAKMQEDGLLPDTFTYTVIINCLGKAGNLTSAYKIFSEMIVHGCNPNLVTYNIMIDLHAKARKYSTTLKLYKDMQNAGIYPDMVTCSIVMEVLGRCRRMEEAEVVFSEMQQAHWIPDETVFGLLVDMWGKAGNVQKANYWYNKMLNSGLRPNIPTCNSLISAFLRVHMYKDAMKVLQTMLQLNLYPSLQTYTLLLSCCSESQCQEAKDLCFSLMASTRNPVHSFVLSLPAAEAGGQNVRDHVATFFGLMHSEEHESKRGLVDAMINFLYKSDLKEEAGFVWEGAMQKNLYPHAVTQKAPMYWLINLHVMSVGTALIALSRTLAWFRELLLISGVGPCRIDIITGWGRRSRVMGSSSVKQAVEHLLHVFDSPFYVKSGNSGCYIGFGDPLIDWLHQPYVERMHLL